MEKIQLNKRTLRTLSSTEVASVGGADFGYYYFEDPYDGGDYGGDYGGGGDYGTGAAPKGTEASICACATDSYSCAPKSQNCPATANLKCCPASGD